MKSLLRLSVWVIGLVGATSSLALNAEQEDDGVAQGRGIKNHVPTYGPDVSHVSSLDKRDVRGKCSMRGYLADIPLVEPPLEEDSEDESVSRRNIDHRDVANATRNLDPRQMTVPHKNRLAFYRRELTKANYQPIVWDIPATQSDFNTAIYEDIGGDKAKSLGLIGLSGCSALIIASRSGVYVAHYFESLSFAPDDVWIDEYGSEEACFEQTVVQGLKKGIPGRGRIKKAQQVSLTDNAAKLRSGGGLRAYLIGPRLDWEDNPETYKPKFRKIKETVGQIVPELSAPGLWTDIPYDALKSNDRRLTNTPTGKLIFKYDPDHGKKGAKKKKAALWVEDSLDLHNDEWI